MAGDPRPAAQDVDRALKRGDVRLTMGGEPTFIAADDMDAPEWNTDALGPTKRNYAGRLIRRLMDRWAPGRRAEPQHGQAVSGRATAPLGAALPLARRRRTGLERSHAARLRRRHRHRHRTGSRRLRPQPRRTAAGRSRPGIPAYEDIHYYLWKEHRLPANVLVEDAKLADPLERARLARVFGQGLASTVGSVLPLRRVIDDGARRWQSGKWFFKSGEMFLIPGDSPIGLRLPLESLPWVDPEQAEYDVEPDPFAPREKLPTRQALQSRPPLPERQQHRELPPGPAGTARHRPDGTEAGDPGVGPHRPGGRGPRRPPARLLPAGLRRRGLARPDRRRRGNRRGDRPQDRPGRLPAAAKTSGCCISPSPPTRASSRSTSTPPAAGPSRSGCTEELYEEARQVGLATEKFNLDGRHVGTGGGNHVVMGARGAEDSPFLRRPDLLKSVVGFWHNHPSLSFLFSGQFIGPTSQHPRVDEARQDSLAELEIAFAQVKPGQPVAALGHRPSLPQHPGGHDRQHPPDRVLHRQDVRPRQRLRPPRPGRMPRLRDAAARPHVGGADPADALRHRGVLGTAV